MTSLLSRQEALVYVMVTASAADTNMTGRELDKIAELIGNKPVFQDFDRSTLVATANACMGMLSSEDGVAAVLDLVAHALPVPLYETAYAFAVEVAAADIFVRQEELVFLQMLEDRLELPKLAVAAIEHSARVRYRLG